MSNTTDIITVPYNFTPRNYQLELFKAMDGIQGQPESRKRRAILRWHRRAGKDKCCWCYLLKEAAQVPGNYFYVFPTKTMARQALWENVDSSGFKLLNHIPKEFIKRQSNQEMLMELVNGSTIRVLGYDKDPDSIRGIACKGAVFSEFAFSDPDSYKTMIPALRESNGWAIFNSTPNGRNHFYELWQNVFKSERWFASLLQTYWPEQSGYSGLINKKLFPEIVDEEGLTIEDVEREYGCSFSSGMKGSYYMDQIEKAYSTDRIGQYSYDDTLKVDTFWDLGIDDSTAVWFRQKINNKLIFIDYYEASGQSLQHYVRMLEDKGYNYGTHYLPHDANQRSLHTGNSTANMIEDMLRDTKVSDDIWVLERLGVQDGINATRARFSRYHFDAGKCLEGIKKLELYHRRWDKRRGVFLKEPVHDGNSHAADAIRMEAISEDLRNDGFYKQNQVKVLSDWDLLD
jgi:hypothetical protein